MVQMTGLGSVTPTNIGKSTKQEYEHETEAEVYVHKGYIVI